MTDNMKLEIQYRAITPRHPVSAVFVRPSPTHWELIVYNRGGLAGRMTILTQDGPHFLEALLPMKERRVVEPDPSRITLCHPDHNVPNVDGVPV